MLGLEREIGSLAPGKRADIILVRADTLGTAPLNDPVGAVVLQSSPANVDTVLVEGEIIKSGGQLVGRDAARAVKELSDRSRDLNARVEAAARSPG